MFLRICRGSRERQSFLVGFDAVFGGGSVALFWGVLGRALERALLCGSKGAWSASVVKGLCVLW